MNFAVDTNYQEMCLDVTVQVTTPTVVTIRIFDKQNPKIVLTDRYKTITNKFTFNVNMPITSKSIIISLFDQKVGNLPMDKERNIQLVSVEKKPLEKRLDAVDILDPKIFYFVDFAQRFCYNAPNLEANKMYESDQGNFLIEYLPRITNHNGKVLATPARISKNTGLIQVSKEQFDKYTVPMRFAILCHEFSHFYLNEDMNNETEADLNGLLIYLSLGYPRIEAYQAYLEVFLGAPSIENKERYDKINAFIMNFDKKKMVLDANNRNQN